MYLVPKVGGQKDWSGKILRNLGREKTQLNQRHREGPAVVLINFNRPDITQRALNRLSSVGPRNFYLSCDGPREGVESDQELVNRTRQLLVMSRLPGEKNYIFSDSNLGLKKNILKTLDLVFSLEKARSYLRTIVGSSPVSLILRKKP